MRVGSVEKKDDYLLVRLDGPFEIREVEPIFRAVGDATRQSGSRRLLMDCLGVTGQAPTLLDRYQIAMKSLNLPKGLRFAMVAREEMLDPARFGQTVARNRGLPFAVFSGVDPAVAWLLSDDDAAPGPGKA